MKNIEYWNGGLKIGLDKTVPANQNKMGTTAKSKMNISTTSSLVSETVDLERKLKALQDNQKNKEHDAKIYAEIFGKRSAREQKFFAQMDKFSTTDRD